MAETDRSFALTPLDGAPDAGFVVDRSAARKLYGPEVADVGLGSELCVELLARGSLEVVEVVEVEVEVEAGGCSDFGGLCESATNGGE